MTADTVTKPETTDDTLTQWPPVAHIIRKEDQPAKEGTIALCGAKLMGIDLGPIVLQKSMCEKCLKILLRDPRL